LLLATEFNMGGLLSPHLLQPPRRESQDHRTVL